MNEPTASQVDAAVRAVLAELFRQPAPVADGLDLFAGRLLALCHVEALAPGTRELAIEPGTVVTPMARDQLKRLGIRVRLVSAGELERLGRRGEWGFAIEEGVGIAEVLRRVLLTERDVWYEVGDDHC